jgi:fatty acyl-CoA reductase
MQNLCAQALVHVSTAYCNCDQPKITEVINPIPGDALGLIQLCKSQVKRLA